MLDLSPTKLVIIFVVAIVLLGPKRLPQVAHQLGAAWAKARAFSQRMDAELRRSVPDLPTSRDIVRYARSPITLLNDLADGQPRGPGTPGDDPAATPGSEGGSIDVAASAATATGEAGPALAGARAGSTTRRPFVPGTVGERAWLQVDGGASELAVLAPDDPALN